MRIDLPHLFNPFFPSSFFPFYGDLRDLPSFPTRRSSDLVPRALSRSARSPRTRWSRGVQRTVLTGGRGPVAMHSSRDRKSTRLNSSHRCISYAVFCLKKKKHGE